MLHTLRVYPASQTKCCTAVLLCGVGFGNAEVALAKIASAATKEFTVRLTGHLPRCPANSSIYLNGCALRKMSHVYRKLTRTVVRFERPEPATLTVIQKRATQVLCIPILPSDKWISAAAFVR